MKSSYYLLLSLCLAFFINSPAQKQFIRYHFTNQQYDTLPLIQYNSSIQAENTNFYLGKDSNIAILPNAIPTQNTYPQSNYTYKERADLNYSITDFPLRAAIKTFSVENDSLIDNCSGVMISKNHMLTAAHCLVSIITDSVFVDSLKICPAFNKGISNGSFTCTYAKQFYYPANYSFSEDLAIVELEDSIGKETGWVGVGFNKSNSFISNGSFFKLSYPSTTISSLDPRVYNGDTLFFSHGAINLIDSNFLGVNSASGIPGESGSSLIRYQNGLAYTSYGTLSLSNSLRHSRINNWEYYAIKTFIQSSILSSTGTVLKTDQNISVFPNPAQEMLHISIPKQSTYNVRLLSIKGQLLFRETIHISDYTINLSDFPKGTYILQIENESSRTIKKIVKF